MYRLVKYGSPTARTLVAAGWVTRTVYEDRWFGMVALVFYPEGWVCRTR